MSGDIQNIMQSSGGCGSDKLQATSYKQRKLQAASHKLQAASNKLLQVLKIQATSNKLQGTSIRRLESILNKCQDTGTWKQFAGALTGLLGKYKCVVWMLHMEGNLMWREPNFVTGCYLQLNSEKLARIIIAQ